MVDGAATDDSGSLTARQRRALTTVRSDRVIIATLAGAGLVVSFMQTLVIPIYPRLPGLLDAQPADVSWVLTATLLSAVISTPISGRLGDMFGKRRILLLLLAILVGGSIICAISSTLIPLVIGRAFQGIGIGVVPLGISILRDVIHPRNLGGAVALVSATLGVGGAVGLPLAATIAEFADWHWLFVLATALGLVAIVAVAMVIPVSTLRTGGAFDYPGAVGLAIGLFGIIMAVSKGAEWGWLSPLTLTLLLGGVLVLIGWGVFELRSKNPLIDLRVASRRAVLLTNLASIAVGFAFFVVNASLPLVLEAPVATGYGLGLPLILASLCLMPLGLVMFFMSPVAARLSAARGARTSLILGSAIVAAGFILAIFFLDQVWHVILVSTITGIGVGFAYAAMPTLIMQSVPPHETAAANGLNSVMRTLGSTFSATLVGVILATHVVVTDGGEVPTREGFGWVFVMGATVVLIGLMISLFIPQRVQRYDTSSIPVQREP
ncbi:MFS transporter [Salinibacterium sp. G-O1]|uniref:MFS transporter n=1 Tax=Salinibacterium sp. G-O1 TaxID=3046208 RepID=UPI0024B8E5D1|nr:MFS transporter [Salinibacterium sp. G-O1]MDJ0333920.1 MFS transporter [Salinibacterium sp. G-O1]